MGGTAGDGIRILVRLTPRGGGDRVDGVAEGVLRARVAAPPVDGAANRALVRLLASELDVAQRDVQLVGGEASRVKQVVVHGIGAEVLDARWPGLRHHPRAPGHPR